MRSLWLILFLLSGCATDQSSNSTVTPGLFNKPGGNVDVFTEHPVSRKVSPEIYVKNKNIQIRPTTKPNTTGSLFQFDDERNFLFESGVPVTVGRFVTVHISSNRVSNKTNTTTAQQNDTPDAGGEKSAEDVEKKLMESLPDLTPADKAEVALIKEFKGRIMHRYDNGDAMIMTSRSSTKESVGNEIQIQARIPYHRLIAGDRITTDDLYDVRIVDSHEGDMVDRASSGWEDEYTLRMSGFNESKSKYAIELEDKRRKLEDVKNRLASRIKSVGSERKKIADERERLRNADSKTREQIDSLTSKVQEQAGVIQEQQATIRDLQPENTPGDTKDGASGND